MTDLLEHLCKALVLPEKDAKVLLDYLAAHQREILLDINDFGDLRPLLPLVNPELRPRG